jgi:hypothetical protein
VWHSDLYIIEKSAKGVSQQALSEGSFFGPKPLRVDDIVVYQQKCSHREHRRRH